MRLQQQYKIVNPWMVAATIFLLNPFNVVAAASAIARAAETSKLPTTQGFTEFAQPLQQVMVTGTTVYQPAELLQFAIAHEFSSHGRTTKAGIADAIELIYREDGYLLAEVEAKHDSNTATLSFVVHEGHIERIRIEGLDQKAAQQVQAYLDPLIGQRPLHLQNFERALMLSSDLSGIDLLSEFIYEDKPTTDAATLRIIASQQKQAGVATIENVPLQPNDAIRGYVVQEIYSLAKGGDMLRLVGLASDEPGDSTSLSGTAYYRTPLGANGGYLEGYAGNAMLEREFRDLALDLKQRGRHAGIGFGYPLRRDLHRFGYLIGSYEYTDARSRVGMVNTDSTSQAIRLIYVQGYLKDDGGMFESSLTLSLGMRPDSEEQRRDGDRRFAHLRAAVGWIEPLAMFSDRTILRAELAGQWTSAALPEVEKFTLGHQPYLRGYTPVEYEGDSGLAGTLELSHQIDRDEKSAVQFSPFIFIDAGRVDNDQPPANQTRSQSLLSAGIGSDLQLPMRWSMSAWLAFPLEDGLLTRSGDTVAYLRISKGW